MEVVKIFETGGPFMYAILAVFALGIAIALERLVVITSVQSRTSRVWAQLVPMLRTQDVRRAEELLKTQDTPLARVLQYGFARLRRNARREAVEAAMEEGIMEVMPELEKRTHYLATLANIATLLGLLGTIIGLIQAFTAVATANPAEKADLLSASISVAMNTTAFGLIAAIPLIFIHTWLATKTTRLVDNIEMATVKCLNLIIED